MTDELGILAWSEFIFSDALYGLNDWFLDSVDVEVRQNVRRINKHASNAQWAGGNEIEGIVQGLNTTALITNGTHYLDEVTLSLLAMALTTFSRPSLCTVCRSFPRLLA